MLYEYEEMQFTDELLGKEVLPQHVERAEKALYAFAKRLGVLEGDIVRSYLVDEFSATLYISFLCALTRLMHYQVHILAMAQTDDFTAKKLQYIDERITMYESKLHRKS